MLQVTNQKQISVYSSVSSIYNLVTAVNQILIYCTDGGLTRSELGQTNCGTTPSSLDRVDSFINSDPCELSLTHSATSTG